MVSIFMLCTQVTDSLKMSTTCAIESIQNNAGNTENIFHTMQVSDWVTSILSLLAIIISFIFTLIPYFKKSKISGKLISIRILSNSKAHIRYKEYTGDIYILKLCLYCANKNYPLKRIDVRMRYEKGWETAIDYYPNKVTFTENGKDVEMKIPADSYLPFNGIIPADHNNHYYLNFIVPGLNHNYPFEEMKLTLNSYKEKSIEICFKKEDIDFNNMLIEEDLLAPIK